MKVIKVVKNDAGNFKSIIKMDNRLQVTYIVGQKVVPSVGKLLAFSEEIIRDGWYSRWLLCLFTSRLIRRAHCEIWLAEADDVQQCDKKADSCWAGRKQGFILTYERAKEFWATVGKLTVDPIDFWKKLWLLATFRWRPSMESSVPPYTVACSSITLLRRLRIGVKE